MNAILRLLAGLGLAGSLAAQEQASTLLTLLDRATTVTVATAVAATDPSPEWHRIAFRTATVLRGEPGAEFDLSEPAGRCCGRALFTMVPGESYLLFLGQHEGDLHPIAGDRGVLALHPALLPHLRALLAARGDAQATARVLTDGLDSDCARIRDDAGMALATLPGLRPDAAMHARVFAAMQQQLEVPTTRLPSLADAAARLDPVDAAATLMPHYLATPSADGQNVLAATLLRLPADRLGAAVAACAPADEPARVRALELLQRAPDAANLPWIERMLDQSPSPRVALAATEALLAHGRAAATLTHRVPRAVLELAQRRAAARPRFRAVDPGSRR